MSEAVAALIERVDAVEARLDAHADAAAEDEGRLTAPDDATGERWDPGQLWAHVAEFIPYWLTEMHKVAADGLEPVPFGRTKRDEGRIAAIARDRNEPRVELMTRLRGHLAQLRAALRELPEAAWSRRGLHETLGEMTMPEIVDDFLVGHLEEHADQLDALA
jgi:hypothetical protein